ncbi:DNA methyltransferase [Corynebacterium kalinowskii]|nr:DNA methyltransferase [Corynebacterium kalinowskii]
MHPQLGQDLKKEIAHLADRRNFGLVFERHQPESVELPSLKVRVGSKVHILSPRGSVTPLADKRLWQVVSIDSGVAELGEVLPNGRDWSTELLGREPETRSEAIDDLVAVAEFRDPIFPGLVETGRVENGSVSDPYHAVINAENFHALQMLTFSHRHAIDAVYIDPPYNTGAKDWKYNNDYVEAEDQYRHSKWLSMMEKRLLLAKELLNPEDSVLICSIDEKEFLRLGLLLEQLFSGARIQMVSTVINPAGAGRAADFSRTDEYLYFVQLGNSKLLPMEREVENVPVVWDTLRRSSLAGARGKKGKGACGPNQFYPIYVNDDSGNIACIGEPLPEDMDISNAPQVEGCTAVFPIRPDGTEMNWGITPDVARVRLAEGHLRAGKRKPKEPQRYVISYLTGGIVRDLAIGKAIISGRAENGSVIAYYPTGKDKMPTTHWNFKSHDAQRYGTEIVKETLPRRSFPYPKSLYAVEDALRFFIKSKPNATVLDFFSGSGTTAHAVMRLNKQDGGRRRTIMITNNEVSADEQEKLRALGYRPGDPEWEECGICDYVTKPRVTAAITGRTPDGDPIKGDYKFTDEFPMSEGFEANAVYYTMTYEQPTMVHYGEAFERIAPLLWLKSGQTGPVISQVSDAGWAIADTYGIVFDTDTAKQLIDALAGTPVAKLVYIVTDDTQAFERISRDLPSGVQSVRLYESYLSNFEINTAGAIQ